MNDIAYLIGLGILTSQEAKLEDIPKRSSAKSIDEFIHFIWLKKHNAKVEDKRLQNGDKPSIKNIKKEEKTNKSEKEESDNGSKSDEKSASEHNHSQKVH